MAFYYVKNGGTATGDAGRYATKQTGSFTALGAANYYASYTAARAATTAPVGGDYILISDLASISETWASFSGSSNLFIVCVDDSNIDQYRTTGNRAQINTGGGDIATQLCSIWGMDFVCGDDLFLGGLNQSALLQDCRLEVTGSGDRFACIGDGYNSVLVNCDFVISNAGAFFEVSAGSQLKTYGGSVSGTSLTGMLRGGSSGGINSSFYNTDLSGVTGTIVDPNLGSTTATDTVDIRFDRCRLAVGATLANTTFYNMGKNILFTRCATTDAASEYQYALWTFGGTVNDDDVIYRQDDEPFTDSGVRISYKIETNSLVSIGEPLKFEFPISRRAELDSPASDTLRFFIVSTSTLTNSDIYAIVYYPDGTTRLQANVLTNAPTLSEAQVLDPLATPTNLTSDAASDWRNGGSPLAGYNEYLIDIDTSSDTGSNCIPSVEFFVTKPSITINIASEYDLL